MSTSQDLKSLVTEARPVIERMLDDAELLAGFRDTAKEKGIDWSQVKALLKAQIQDERDDGKRVSRIIEKADFAAAYADMLGLAKMNKNNFSDRHPPTVDLPRPNVSNPPFALPAEPYPEMPDELKRRHATA